MHLKKNVDLTQIIYENGKISFTENFIELIHRIYPKKEVLYRNQTCDVDIGDLGEFKLICTLPYISK